MTPNEVKKTYAQRAARIAKVVTDLHWMQLAANVQQGYIRLTHLLYKGGVDHVLCNYDHGLEACKIQSTPAVEPATSDAHTVAVVAAVLAAGAHMTDHTHMPVPSVREQALREAWVYVLGARKQGVS